MDVSEIFKITATAMYGRQTPFDPQGVKTWRYTLVYREGQTQTIVKTAHRLYPRAFFYDYPVTGNKAGGLPLYFAFGDHDRFAHRRPALGSWKIEVIDARANRNGGNG